MGSVCRVNGFAVSVWSNDHPPPHVHVRKPGEGAASFWIGDDDTPPSYRYNKGMNAKNYKKAFRVVCDYQSECIEEWEHVHGSEETG
jgi:hypothetical protein